MLKREIEKIIKKAVGKEAELEHPAKPEFGDYSTNVALKERIKPKEIVEKLKDNPLFEKVEIAGPGFINFFLSPKCLRGELAEIIRRGEKYGDLEIGKGKKVQVEFISANPTGPLTVGNARGGPFGDVLANVLKKAGYEAEKAYYINDCGAQILALGHSVLKDAEAKYKGEYIDELNHVILSSPKAIPSTSLRINSESRRIQPSLLATGFFGLRPQNDKKKRPQNDNNIYQIGQWAAKEIIEKFIGKTIDRLGIKYDEWTSESKFHKSGKVDEVLNFLKENNLIYEKEGAWWFSSSKYGDDKDRPVIKSDGSKTYLAGDIAHHRYKFEEKKFDKVIDIWGADHHGDIKRLKAAMEVLGFGAKLDIVILQFVTLLEKGEKKRMSKRAGVLVLMDELLDKVGVDAARFFLLQKSPDAHLNFDIALAKEQSKKNPVYYVQYAYARICSVLNKSFSVIASSAESGTRNDKKGTAPRNDNFSLLTHPAELNLIRRLIKFPEIIEQTAKDYQVQRLPYYSLELAEQFHRFYEQCRVIDENNRELTQARISLIKGVQIVLADVLKIMGISAPEKM